MPTGTFRVVKEPLGFLRILEWVSATSWRNVVCLFVFMHVARKPTHLKVKLLLVCKQSFSVDIVWTWLYYLAVMLNLYKYPCVNTAVRKCANIYIFYFQNIQNSLLYVCLESQAFLVMFGYCLGLNYWLSSSQLLDQSVHEESVLWPDGSSLCN